MKTKTVLVKRQLCITDSLINSFPFFFTTFVWMGMLVIGNKAINEVFVDDPFYGLITVVWLLLMLSLVKLIRLPVVTISSEHIEDEQ